MVFGISGWWILLAVLVYFGIGAVWYSKLLFAPLWLREMKRPEADVTVAASAMATTIACIVVLVLLEAYLVRTIGVVGWLGGLVFGFKLWLGFAATTALINSSFQSGSKKLYLIDQGYHLVGIALAGAILAHQVIVT